MLQNLWYPSIQELFNSSKQKPYTMTEKIKNTIAKMKSPNTFILECIMKYEKEYKSFGSLNAKYIDDIAKMMTKFTEETILNVIDRINNGEQVLVGDQLLSFNKSKKT